MTAKVVKLLASRQGAANNLEEHAMHIPGSAADIRRRITGARGAGAAPHQTWTAKSVVLSTE
jgi:hypothetical protein